jgi:hypothetical protein
VRRTRLIAAIAIATLAATSLLLASTAAAKKPSQSSTPVFNLMLKPSQETPAIKNLRARARGSVTFDLTRDANGAITAGTVIFTFNYHFPSAVTVTGLHIHHARKGEAGPIVVDSGIASVVDGDGNGNITAVVAGVSPVTLQAILDHPRDYYVNLHTSANPGGALREQMHNPRKG